jgi:hypothetical protein
VTAAAILGDVMPMVDAVADAWRVRPISVPSVLRPRDARARIHAGLLADDRKWRELDMATRLLGPWPRTVQGRFSGWSMTLRRRTQGRRNSWGPQLVGRIVTIAGGRSQVRGYIGVPLFVRIFTAVWLSMAIVLELIAVLAAVQHGLRDVPIPLLIIPLGLFAFGLTLAVAGTRAGREEEAFLLEWLTRQVNPEDVPDTDDDAPGHRSGPKSGQA